MWTSAKICKRKLLLIAILLLGGLCVTNRQFKSAAQLNGDALPSPRPQQNVRVLLPNDIFQQVLKGTDVHTYEISLATDQFARITVDQRGVDLVLKLSGGDEGEVLVDNPNGSFGIESASILAGHDGTFTITVRTNDPNRNGTYDLKVEGPRGKISGDQERVRAERIFAKAQQDRRAGHNQEAIDKYNEAGALWNLLSDPQHQAYALCNIGRIHRGMGKDHFEEALADFKRALEYSQSAGDISGQAFVLNEIGAAYRELADPLQAQPYYEKALTLRQKLNDVLGLAQILNNEGLMYAKVGRQKTAIENYEKALALWLEAPDPSNSSRVLNNIGESYSDLGDLSQASDKFHEALIWCRKSGNRSIEASIENNLGKIYDTWADSQPALDSYQHALSIFRELRDERNEATVDENIGMVYAGLNDTASALEYLQKALAIRERLKEPRGTAIALDHLGFVQGLIGLHAEAIKNLQRSISLSQETHNRAFEAYSLTNLGISYFSLGDSGSASASYYRALEIQRDLGDLRGQAITLDKLGQLSASTLQGGNVLTSYDEALRLWTSIGDKQGQALTLYGMARINRDQGKLEVAQKRIEDAIDIVESVRAGMSSTQLRVTYFAAKEELYELDVDVRMQLGLARKSNADLEAALYSSERSRARNLLDLLNVARAKDAANLILTDRDKTERLLLEMSSLRQNLFRLRAAKRTEDVVFVEEQLSKLAIERDEIRSRNALEEYSNLRCLTASQIQALLDEDTLLLEYSLGAQHSYLWAITRTKISGYSLPRRNLIETDVEKFRRAITAYEPRRPGEKTEDYIARLRNAAANYRRYGEALSLELLENVRDELPNKRLVIVADGALQYIPFGALPFVSSVSPQAGRDTSYTPLIFKNEIVNEPSASSVLLLRTRPRSTPTKVVAVFADPVFDPKDPRVVEGSEKTSANSITAEPRLKQALRDIGDTGSSDEFRLDRLQFSAAEAGAIGKLAPTSSQVSLNFDANRSSVLSTDLRQFRIVHFATHGVLNARHPELSGIVLSMVDERGRPQDGFLMLSDVYDLNIPVDLVVLSACQTGIGKQVRGEGLVALPRGFLLAGARRVVASLWRVDDEATAELMKSFYSHMLNEKMPAVSALRQAQIDMITKRDQWRAPYYWAGFVLQGEWK